MALGTAAATQAGGRSPSQPLTHDRLTFLGDDAYTVGGTLLFEAYVQTALNRTVELLSCTGYGGDGTDLTHYAEYDAAADALKCYVIATGVEIAGAVDLSGTTFVLDCTSR